MRHCLGHYCAPADPRPFNVISVPPGVMHGFRCVRQEPADLLAIQSGAYPGRVTYAAECRLGEAARPARLSPEGLFRKRTLRRAASFRSQQKPRPSRSWPPPIAGRTACSSLDARRRPRCHDMASLVRDQVLVCATPALQRGFHGAPSEFQGFWVVRERGSGQLRFGAAPNRGRACVSRGQTCTFGASGNRHKRCVANTYTAFEGPAAICRQFYQGTHLRLPLKTPLFKGIHGPVKPCRGTPPKAVHFLLTAHSRLER